MRSFTETSYPVLSKVSVEYICVKNIVPATYYDGEMPVLATKSPDKTNERVRIAREIRTNF